MSVNTATIYVLLVLQDYQYQMQTQEDDYNESNVSE